MEIKGTIRRTEGAKGGGELDPGYPKFAVPYLNLPLGYTSMRGIGMSEYGIPLALLVL